MYTNTHSQTGGGKWLWITIGSIVLLLAIASFIERQNLKDWYNNHFNKPKEASISAYNIKVTDPLKAPPAEPNKPTWDQLGIGYEYIAADGDKISLQSSQAGISDPKDRSNLWSFLDWADKSIAIRNNSLDKFLTKDLNLSTDINSSKWILKQIDSAKNTFTVQNADSKKFIVLSGDKKGVTLGDKCVTQAEEGETAFYDRCEWIGVENGKTSIYTQAK